jgi:hypothetical protein
MYQQVKATPYLFANEKWYARAVSDASYEVREAYASESGASDRNACISLTVEQVIARISGPEHS